MKKKTLHQGEPLPGAKTGTRRDVCHSRITKTASQRRASRDSAFCAQLYQRCHEASPTIGRCARRAWTTPCPQSQSQAVSDNALNAGEINRLDERRTNGLDAMSFHKESAIVK